MFTRPLTKWLLISQIAAAGLYANTTDNLAESLIKLRSEVETLHTKLDDSKDEYKNQMKSYALTRSDLEASISREELKIKQLQQALIKTQERIKKQSASSAGLKPLLLDALSLVEAQIKKGLPFKMQERLSQIDEIRNQVNNDLIMPEKALSRIWAVYEDNFRMTKENGMFSQNITLDGSERLADVVRLGSVMMYFKTSDSRMGYVKQTTEGDSYVEVVDPAEKEQIAVLFDAMKKQIRTGYFNLPNGLAERN
jgi:hypothetical protein